MTYRIIFDLHFFWYTEKKNNPFFSFYLRCAFGIFVHKKAGGSVLHGMEQTLDIYNLITVDETQRWKIPPEARKSAKKYYISMDSLKMMKSLNSTHTLTISEFVL